MREDILVRLFEHNNWANRQIIDACAALGDEKLDAEPHSATRGNIRHTLWHLVSAQQGYLSLLTRQPRRYTWEAPPSLDELREADGFTGAGLLTLVRDGARAAPTERLRASDGYTFDPWVVLVQVINHASEHREQINSMLTALGVTPPRTDGWQFGETEAALAAPDDAQSS